MSGDEAEQIAKLRSDSDFFTHVRLPPACDVWSSQYRAGIQVQIADLMAEAAANLTAHLTASDATTGEAGTDAYGALSRLAPTTDNTPTTKQEEGGLVAVPTQEMLDAGIRRFLTYGIPASLEGEYLRLRAVYGAMLDAAPKGLDTVDTPATPPHNEDGLRKALEDAQRDFGHILARLVGRRTREARIVTEAALQRARQALGDIPSG